MNVERIVAGSERDFVEKSVDYIEQAICARQRADPEGCFVLGLSQPNGKVRRARAGDTFTELAARESIDWERVRIFLVDERYDASSEEDSNAELVRKSLGKLGADVVLAPDVSLASAEESAADYEQRLNALLARHAPEGPHLTSLSLSPDGSVASIFPEWYAAEPERWARATQKRFGVLCTRTTSFECGQRIAVNLRVVRKSKSILVFTGNVQRSEEVWKDICRRLLGARASPLNARNGAAADSQPPRPAPLARRVSSPAFAPPAHQTPSPADGRGDGAAASGASAGASTDASASAPAPRAPAGVPASPLDWVMKYARISVVQLKKDDVNAHAFVLLGAAGDLAAKKTFPSLFKLYLGRYLPHNFAIVGCDGAAFHPDVTSADELWERRIEPHLRQRHGASARDLAEFRALVSFCAVEMADGASVAALHEHICARAAGCARDHRCFYLALPSKVFGQAVEALRGACWSATGACRVVVEKPFGRNGAEARALSQQLLGAGLREAETFRIDHYLAKTLVTNLLAFRFANRELGRLFHADNVANVRITFKEAIGVEGRAGYFDEYGIIRDIMQNHLMQVLTLVAMEAPASLGAEDVRDEKVKVLKQIRPIAPAECEVGQYEGYQDDADIQRLNAARGYASRCPTFAVAVLYLDNERWSGVPFILKAGKALETTQTLIRLQFKKAPPHSLFGEQPQNELVIRIQPNEAIYYKILAKMTGLQQRAQDVQQTVLDLDLKKRFDARHMPEAYEKLIHDVLQGESHNFVRRDELEQAWRVFDPLLHALESVEQRVPARYAVGSRGPRQADALINSMGFTRYTVTGVPGFAEEDRD